MDITSTISCQCRVVASLEAETHVVSVKVFAEAEYAPGRGTTAELGRDELPRDLVERVRAVLAEVQAYAEPKLGARIQHAIFKSAEVAILMGEL